MSQRDLYPSQLLRLWYLVIATASTPRLDVSSALFPLPHDLPPASLCDPSWTPAHGMGTPMSEVGLLQLNLSENTLIDLP